MTAATLAPVRVGTARRVNRVTARHHFAAGGTVLVHDGLELELPVTESTTVHTRDRVSWSDLVDMVDMWRNRHVRQGFYVVTYRPPVCSFPPVRTRSDQVRPGDILPLLGTVDTVDHAGGRVLMTFTPGSVARFTNRSAARGAFYPHELVHVSTVSA